MIAAASALAAFVLDEPGHRLVEDHLIDGCVVPAVAATEFVLVLVRRGYAHDDALDLFADLDQFVAPVTREIALAATSFEAIARAHDLSLADRTCIATSVVLGEPAITCDRAWVPVCAELGVDVILAR